MEQEKREKGIVLSVTMRKMILKLIVAEKDYVTLTVRKLVRKTMSVRVNILLRVQDQGKHLQLILTTYHPLKMKNKVSSIILIIIIKQ